MNRYLLGVCALLGACAGAPRKAAVGTQAALQQLEQREQALVGQDFSLDGRIALSNGKEGGSGRFQWQQQADALHFALSAPLSNQTWSLDGRPGAFRLTDSAGRVRASEDAEALVREASNWTIPVAELKYWVRGLRAPGSQATAEFAADGSLRRLLQAHWQIEYLSWSKADPALPLKLTASRDQARVKVLVKHWLVKHGQP